MKFKEGVFYQIYRRPSEKELTAGINACLKNISDKTFGLVHQDLIMLTSATASSLIVKLGLPQCVFVCFMSICPLAASQFGSVDSIK